MHCTMGEQPVERVYRRLCLENVRELLPEGGIVVVGEVVRDVESLKISIAFDPSERLSGQESRLLFGLENEINRFVLLHFRVRDAITYEKRNPTTPTPSREARHTEATLNADFPPIVAG